MITRCYSRVSNDVGAFLGSYREQSNPTLGSGTGGRRKRFMNFKSKVFRFRDRVPVHHLFVKIFSWFWVTALVIIGIIFVGRRVMDLRPIDPSTMYASVARMLAAEATRAYESGGPAGFVVSPIASLVVMKASFSCSMNSTRMYYRERSPGTFLRLASEAGKDQLVTKYIPLYERVAAYKFVSTSGRPYHVGCSTSALWLLI